MQPPALEDTIVLARQAHAGQVDKAGAPYIELPVNSSILIRIVKTNRKDKARGPGKTRLTWAARHGMATTVENYCNL